MHDSIKALYADLAKALGVDAIPANADGHVQLTVGDTESLLLVAENADTLLLMCPVCALPAAMDHGRALFLLRRNFHDSPLMPFRVACDAAGSVLIWGRMPVDGMRGESLASLIDAVAAEARLIREEIEVDDSAESGDDAEA